MNCEHTHAKKQVEWVTVIWKKWLIFHLSFIKIDCRRVDVIICDTATIYWMYRYWFRAQLFVCRGHCCYLSKLGCINRCYRTLFKCRLQPFRNHWVSPLSRYTIQMENSFNFNFFKFSAKIQSRLLHTVYVSLYCILYCLYLSSYD